MRKELKQCFTVNGQFGGDDGLVEDPGPQELERPLGGVGNMEGRRDSLENPVQLAGVGRAGFGAKNDFPIYTEHGLLPFGVSVAESDSEAAAKSVRID